MSALVASLKEKIASRRARAGVVGLGYVGLPLAVELAKAGFHATGIDLDEPQDPGHQRRAVVHPGRRQPPTSRRCTTGGQARRDHGFFRRQGARHHQHLRADAAPQDEGPGHVLHRLGRRGDRRAPAPRHADLPRIDDLSGHDRRSRAAAPRGQRAESRHRLLPRVLPRARRSGQPDVSHAQRAEGRRRPDAGLLEAGERALRLGRSTRSCRSARRGSRRWSSCSRTRSARSTSGWSTSWR